MGRPKGSWTGKANPQWRGGQYVTAEGYVFIKNKAHPNADKRGYVREHVLIMSNYLGRAIRANEVVHHINGKRGDNRHENLVVMTRQEHTSHHHKGLIKPNSLKNIIGGHTSEEMKHIWATSRKHHRAKPKTCDYCGKQFNKERLKGRPTHKNQFCDRACFQSYRKEHYVKSH